MENPALSNSQLSLVPLGAGDLIDRAFRFYRKHFWSFIVIGAPPVVAGMLFSIGWTVLARYLFLAGSTTETEVAFYDLFVGLGSFLIWTVQIIATLVVMGGASRNFVRHLLHGEPITFRETYKNAASRLPGLIGISTLLTLVLGTFGLFIVNFGLAIATIAIMGSAFSFQSVPIFAFLISSVIGIGITFATLWLLFLLISRFVYVPQIMLVEGQGAFSALSRSMTLAGKNVKRVAMLFIFTSVATYSALAILYIPLGWVAWYEGVSLFSFDAADSLPAWYEIASQVISQASFILLTPVWMIGFCLLYIDERVRSEGYDIELLAAKRLGDIPSVPNSYVNPLQPALSKPGKVGEVSGAGKKGGSGASVLGLD